MSGSFIFKPVSPDDFPLLVRWHQQPHIKEIWHPQRTPEEVARRYGEKLKEEFLRMFVVFHGDRPIGFIQAYKAADVENGWWPDEPETTWGIDLFIGEPDCLGRGLGSEFIRQFSDELLEKPEIEKVIADPAPSNKRSVRAFEKAGFKIIGPTVTPDGDAILLEKV